MSETNGFRYLLITPAEQSPTLRQIITDALQEVGIDPILLEETIVPGTSIVEPVQQAIARADIIIVDLTVSNPNVMYEVGFAHALRKPVLPIVQPGVNHVPSDIAGYLFFVYDPSAPDELRRNIQTWAVRHHNKRMQGELSG